MIRDNVFTGKQVKKTKKSYKAEEYGEKLKFSSLCRIIDSIYLSDDFSYLKLLNDPFALMLVFGARHSIQFTESEGVTSEEYLCEDIYWALHGERDLQDVYDGLSSLERFYLKQIVSGDIEGHIPPRDIFRAFSQSRNIDQYEAYHTWVLQPDPFVMANSIIHPGSDMRHHFHDVPAERITPARGYAMNFVYPTQVRSKARFPALIQPFIKGRRVMVHKSFNDIRIFDENKKMIHNDGVEEHLKQYSHSGILDGVIVDDDFRAFDLLEINDVWLFRRPLADRMKFFWRFADVFVSSFFVFSSSDFGEKIETAKDLLSKDLVVKPLNKDYCPLRLDGVINWSSDNVKQLRIVGMGNFLFLAADEYNIFMLPKDIYTRDKKFKELMYGRVVDVTEDGRVLRYRDDLINSTPFDEVYADWDIDFDSAAPAVWNIGDSWDGKSLLY